MTSDRRQQIAESLRDKQYRDDFVAEFINTGVAFQIHETREARGWTQAELGERAGMAQESISLLENPDYGKFTLRTLERLASALDVALVVRFVPFSQLVDWVVDLDPEDVAVAGFDEEQRAHAMKDELTSVNPAPQYMLRTNE
jgi:transcriptional regulator with XRE-family HTH domain